MMNVWGFTYAASREPKSAAELATGTKERILDKTGDLSTILYFNS